MPKKSDPFHKDTKPEFRLLTTSFQEAKRINEGTLYRVLSPKGDEPTTPATWLAPGPGPAPGAAGDRLSAALARWGGQGAGRLKG